MKKALSFLGLITISHLALFILGTMFEINWQFPQLAWRGEVVEVVKSDAVEEFQPISFHEDNQTN